MQLHETKEEAQYTNEYDVYHDECQIGGYWHGILFVPRHSRTRLVTLLAQVRTNTERTHPISLKNLENPSGRLCRCIACWIQIGVASLIQDFKGKAYSIPTGKEGRWADFCRLTQLIGAKFILFRVKGG